MAKHLDLARDHLSHAAGFVGSAAKALRRGECRDGVRAIWRAREHIARSSQESSHAPSGLSRGAVAVRHRRRALERRLSIVENHLFTWCRFVWQGKTPWKTR